MNRIRTLFLLLTIVGPMHMAEQLLFGIEEFFSIKGYVASYYTRFEPAAADLSLYDPHPTPQDTWPLEWRRAELPAMNGHGNARGIATMQSLLACGSASGVRLISDAGRARVLEQQSDGADLVIGVPCRWGMGFSLELMLFPDAPAGARAAWWGGKRRITVLD